MNLAFMGHGAASPSTRIEFHDFKLDDRLFLEKFFKAGGGRLCEYSFAVQYCWQSYNKSVWAILNDTLVIRFETGGQFRFTCPVGFGDSRRAVDSCLEWLANAGSPPAIDYVPDSPGCSRVPDGLAALPDPDNNDYIYLRTDLAELPGKRFAHKRNHISALSRDHQWRVVRLNADDRRHELLDYVHKWALDRADDAGDRDLQLELDAVRRAIEFAVPLGLEVFGLDVDGALAGMAICDRTHSDMATVHFEKADAAVRGAYQAICSGVASLMPPDVVYMNREQDMGVEGLRKTKSSWHPVLIEKCRILRPAVDGAGVAGHDAGAIDADV